MTFVPAGSFDIRDVELLEEAAPDTFGATVPSSSSSTEKRNIPSAVFKISTSSLEDADVEASPASLSASVTLSPRIQRLETFALPTPPSPSKPSRPLLSSRLRWL